MKRDELLDRLDRTRSRGQVKALGAAADRDPKLRQALLLLAAERGLELASTDGSGAGEQAAVPGKLLVRRVLQRAGDAQLRQNPIHRDESFACSWCGAAVVRGGAQVRDHCPRCLRSVHVDVVPGDRAADCGGVLQPASLQLLSGQVIIHYCCDRCGHLHRVRAHADDDVPPDLSVAALPGRARRGGAARTLPRRLIEFIRRRQLWQPGDHVLVAVSGGLDSTVLLELLWRTQDAHGARLSVMSLDHGLRSEAAAEVAGVAAHAARLDLPMFSQILQLERGPGLQERARVARRTALQARATTLGATRIATAHHLDDQAETVLQRLCAGSGSQGLSGMAAVSPPWCRPLLDQPRRVLLDWARAEGLQWVEDPSNSASQRGHIRTLLASLGEVRAGWTQGLARSASLLARDDQFLEHSLDEHWLALFDDGCLKPRLLTELHPALQARALRRLCAQQGLVPRADLLDQVMRALPTGSGVFDLGRGHCLRLTKAGLVVVMADDRVQTEPA